MSSLNIALFAFQYPCFSIHLCSAITLIVDSSSCPLYLGNLLMSPTWQISLVVLSICYMLPWVISVLCSLFKDSSHYLIYKPDPITVISVIHLLMSTFFCPVHSHSCDPLEDLLPSLSQYGSVSALPEDEDLEFDGSTSGFTFLIGEFLCFSCQLSSIGWQTVESSPCSTSAYLYSHGLDCTWFFGILYEDLSSSLMN